jgi:hypothetical protein
MMLAVVTTRPAMAQAPDIITTSGVGTSVDPVRATLDVTVGSASPDCVPRKVILINGRFQPMLRLTQGDWVEVRLLPHAAEQQPALLGAGGGIAEHSNNITHLYVSCRRRSLCATASQRIGPAQAMAYQYTGMALACATSRGMTAPATLHSAPSLAGAPSHTASRHGALRAALSRRAHAQLLSAAFDLMDCTGDIPYLQLTCRLKRCQALTCTMITHR